LSYIHSLEFWSTRPQKKWRASSTNKEFLIRPRTMYGCVSYKDDNRSLPFLVVCVFLSYNGW